MSVTTVIEFDDIQSAVISYINESNPDRCTIRVSVGSGNQLVFSFCPLDTEADPGCHAAERLCQHEWMLLRFEFS